MEPKVDRGMWSVVALLAAIVIGGVVLIAFPKISGKIANNMDDTVSKAFNGDSPKWLESAVYRDKDFHEIDGKNVFNIQKLNFQSANRDTQVFKTKTSSSNVVNLFSKETSRVGYYEPRPNKETGFREFNTKTGTKEYTTLPFSFNKDSTYYLKVSGQVPKDQDRNFAFLTTVQFHNDEGKAFDQARVYVADGEPGESKTYDAIINRDEFLKWNDADHKDSWDKASYISVRTRWLVNDGKMVMTENKKIEELMLNPLDQHKQGNNHIFETYGGNSKSKLSQSFKVEKGQTYVFSGTFTNYGSSDIKINIQDESFTVKAGESISKAIDLIAKEKKVVISVDTLLDNRDVKLLVSE